MSEHSGISGQLPDALPPATEAALDNVLDAHHLAEHFGLADTIAEYRARRELLRTAIATALREARREALVEACKAQCIHCREGAPFNDKGQHLVPSPSLYMNEPSPLWPTLCCARKVRALATPTPERDTTPEGARHE